ncbi:MAG: bifunctional folylpolyglutamate synthase/dihydrofolate synthase [Cytophagales bacterium]|nr:bifunctional folylpolyglutamate synthase/dihydrofolate synthase [Armatimonadota bacterium]
MNSSDDLTYEQSVAYLSGLLTFGIRLDRERFIELLRRAGDPHQRLRCLHVAGTNGKGSTTTFIASILRAAGYSVGAYLSPYVFDLRERIQRNGEMIPKADFARWVSVLRPQIEAIETETDLGPTTEFELKTAIAFCWLAEQDVDFAVIEVGIGGRLDATNVIPPPLVAVITSIGYDHQSLLGDTLAKIAGEKAGILKRGTLACVTAVPPGEAFDAIAAKAEQEGMPLRTVSAPAPPQDSPLLLRGPFQRQNAATARAAVLVLRDHGIASLSDAALRQGLAGATLPGRFQIALSGDPALVLDVAHNEDGARVLVEALKAEMPGRRYRFIVGMSRNHDPIPFLRELIPLVRDSEIIVTAPRFRPKPIGEVTDAARGIGLKVRVIEPASAAIARTFSAALPGEVVVVTGSFYTVGETPPELRGADKGG